MLTYAYGSRDPPVRRADPTRFLHHFEFRDEKAEELHSSSPAVERFTSVLYPLCVQPVEFSDLALLATTESQPS